jgi:hypothetical protein
MRNVDAATIHRRSTILAALLAIATVILSPSLPVTAQQGQGPESGLPEVEGWAILTPLLAPVSEQAVV